MLTGKLVRLRPLELDDIDRCLAWINDYDVKQYVNNRYPISRESEEEWLCGATKRTGYDGLMLAIETLTDGRHIGNLALDEVRPEARKACLGIMIGDKDFWSRGFGTDAILTLLRFAFDEMNLNRVWLEVHDDNARAIACYRKCGFVEEGRLRQHRFKAGAYHDTIVMGVLASEFEALHPRAEAPA
jgi:RimJ/RimL family protein N-acetyltransferase